MKVSKRILKFLQEGGPITEDPAVSEGEVPAPEEQGGADQAVAQMAQQLVQMLMEQIGDPQAVTAILQMALDMVAGAAQEQAPVYQKLGGKVTRKK